jgi:hypothetical protein
MMRSMYTMLAAVLLLNVAVHAAAPDMKEGLWEITVTVEMPGLPAGMPAQRIEQCVTQKDLEDPRRIAPGARSEDGKCRVTSRQQRGDTLTWDWSCEGPEAASGTSTMTFSGTTYSGTNQMSMKQGGQVHAMTMRYSGKHIGACPR